MAQQAQGEASGGARLNSGRQGRCAPSRLLACLSRLLPCKRLIAAAKVRNRVFKQVCRTVCAAQREQSSGGGTMERAKAIRWGEVTSDLSVAAVRVDIRDILVDKR